MLLQAGRRGCNYRVRRRTRPQLHPRSEEHTSELQSHVNLVCRLLLEKKKGKVRRSTGSGGRASLRGWSVGEGERVRRCVGSVCCGGRGDIWVGRVCSCG